MTIGTIQGQTFELEFLDRCQSGNDAEFISHVGIGLIASVGGGFPGGTVITINGNTPTGPAWFGAAGIEDNDTVYIQVPQGQAFFDFACSTFDTTGSNGDISLWIPTQLQYDYDLDDLSHGFITEYCGTDHVLGSAFPTVDGDTTVFITGDTILYIPNSDPAFCDSVLHVTVAQFEPSICIVTDSLGYNTVLFEKNDPAPNVSYSVYRDGLAIGTVDPGEYSVFIDSTSNNLTQSYEYSIGSASMTCDSSLVSSVHKTIHLQSNLGTGSEANLSWTQYVGLDLSRTFIRHLSHQQWPIHTC